jgi:hypothetical protein
VGRLSDENNGGGKGEFIRGRYELRPPGFRSIHKPNRALNLSLIIEPAESRRITATAHSPAHQGPAFDHLKRRVVHRFDQPMDLFGIATGNSQKLLCRN